MFNPLEKLSASQIDLLKKYQHLLWEVNQEINVISRQTTFEDYWLRHIYHCLFLAYKDFPKGATVVDFGTGGGLPGIPLAICFPDTKFVLIDSTVKKINAVSRMCAQLGLYNVDALPIRAETYPRKAHYAVSRATAPLADLWRWYAKCRIPLEETVSDEFWQPGLICLKGGNLQQEKQRLLNRYTDLEISENMFTSLSDEPFFAEKCLLQVSKQSQV